MRDVRVRVNGEEHARAIEPRLLLSDFLRHELGLTGTHVGCEHGVCGACTVLLDGEPVRSCLIFAVQAEGHEVTTVEGLASPPGGRGTGPNGADGEAARQPVPGGAAAPLDPGAPADPALQPLQAAFRDAHGLQCGFCTPGILMTAVAFLEEKPRPTRREIREAISGHLCRCTGYQKIVDAIELAAERVAAEWSGDAS